MKDKFAITITDLNGSRTYLLSDIIKKALIYFALIFVLVLVGGGYYIYRISSTTERLRDVRDSLKTERANLTEQNDKYKAELVSLEERIRVSTEKYDAIEDKIAQMEENLGLNPDAQFNLSDRIEIVQLNALEKQLIFTQIPNGTPMQYRRVSSRFGWRLHPTEDRSIFHHGVDLAAEIGTPIYATATGIVEFAGYNTGGYGYLVTINHNFGFKTRYAHMTKDLKVQNGQFVQKGDIIGYCGNTGRSTGPHLHYEVMFLSRHLQPLNFIDWDIKTYENIFEKEKNISWDSLLKIVTATIRSKLQ